MKSKKRPLGYGQILEAVGTVTASAATIVPQQTTRWQRSAARDYYLYVGAPSSYFVPARDLSGLLYGIR